MGNVPFLFYSMWEKPMGESACWGLCGLHLTGRRSWEVRWKKTGELDSHPLGVRVVVCELEPVTCWERAESRPALGCQRVMLKMSSVLTWEWEVRSHSESQWEIIMYDDAATFWEEKRKRSRLWVTWKTLVPSAGETERNIQVGHQCYYLYSLINSLLRVALKAVVCSCVITEMCDIWFVLIQPTEFI